LASPPLIAIVCSDRHRNGKTLLARSLVDFLLLEGHDPFVLDLGFPDGALRDFFPGRTALVDFAHVAGQMKVFDTILAGTGRDYVIDVPAQQLTRFCEAMSDLDFRSAAKDAGFALVVLFVVDEARESLKSAEAVDEILAPDLFIPVANHFVGSALPDHMQGLTLTMERLDPDLHPIIGQRRFSFRSFLLGEESPVPLRLRPGLKSFLRRLMDGFREIDPALSLLKLRS
jgi:hypothetical protein